MRDWEEESLRSYKQITIQASKIGSLKNRKDKGNQEDFPMNQPVTDPI